VESAGFLIPQVVQKHKLGEVRKQSTFGLPAFSVTLLPKIIVIEPCMSRL